MKKRLTKLCKSCNIEKTIEDNFYSNGNRSRSTCKDCHNKSTKKWNDANKDKYSEITANAKIKYRYGLTKIEYKSLLDNQGGVCKICKQKKKLNIDHCHSSGKIRGLLCVNCNTGIGQFKDDIGLLQKAIEYLRDSS